jgi:transposase
LPNANHGRYGFEDYAGLETRVIKHTHLQAGDACPSCEEAEQSGKVYLYEAGYLIRLVGQPLVTGTRYQLAGFRCHLCGDIYKPEVPQAIKEAPKYAPSAVSNIAIGHYYLGLPFHRIETLQANYCIPLADATQYDEMAKLTKKVSPVMDYLETLSANSALFYYDNTPQKILDLAKGQATAMVSTYGTYSIYLFYTSQRSGGKEVSRLLKPREVESPFITMTDAAKSNELSDSDETLLSRLIVAYCLVHGRRKFHELLEVFPQQCQFVIECIAEIYRHEAHCKQSHYSPRKRLDYHQTHSTPIMGALKTYLTNLWLYGGVEHNSALGNAVRYMLKRWEALTRFLHVEGCPMDNSLCEQAIKVLIRYRKNSLFYKTLKGALCGDTLMSLIHTAVKNKINAFNYLNALQMHAKAVAISPQHFLPWNYQATLGAMQHHQAA